MNVHLEGEKTLQQNNLSNVMPQAKPFSFFWFPLLAFLFMAKIKQTIYAPMLQTTLDKSAATVVQA